MTKYPKCALVAALLLGFTCGWFAQERHMEEKQRTAEMVKRVDATYQAQLKRLSGE
ncbi:MAG: hypothetical protein Q7R63_00700 [bacterium]|nr:hypothetical protein [bacterium]